MHSSKHVSQHLLKSLHTLKKKPMNHFTRKGLTYSSTDTCRYHKTVTIPNESGHSQRRNKNQQHLPKTSSFVLPVPLVNDQTENLWNRVVNDQTENHETKWSEKEAGACWSYFANVQPRSTKKTSGHKKGVASDENSLYMVSFPLMRMVSMRSPSLSWEWSLHGLLPSHEKGLFSPQRVGLTRVVSGLHRGVASHKSGLWSPQRGGLSWLWSFIKGSTVS